MNEFNKKNVFPNSTPDFHNRILETLNNLPHKKEINIMKRSKSLKRIIIVAAVIIAMSTTAAAGNVLVTKYYTSGNKPPITLSALPTTEEIKTDYGFEVTPLNSFSNGYTFKNAYSDTTVAVGENEERIAEFQTLNIRYANSQNEISIHVSSYYENIENVAEGSEYSETHNDIDIYYNNDTYKLIDSDYVLTEQDKIDIESGKYVFNEGGGRQDGIVSDIVVDDYNFISWIDNDLCFLLMARNSDLSRDDLLNMAKEYIDAN